MPSPPQTTPKPPTNNYAYVFSEYGAKRYKNPANWEDLVVLQHLGASILLNPSEPELPKSNRSFWKLVDGKITEMTEEEKEARRGLSKTAQKETSKITDSYKILLKKKEDEHKAKLNEIEGNFDRILEIQENRILQVCTQNSKDKRFFMYLALGLGSGSFILGYLAPSILRALGVDT